MMRLLLIGNYLSEPGFNQNTWQDLASRLLDAGYNVCTTSARPNKAMRLMDMLATIWQYRKDFDVAQIDVFSGLAFAWADLCASLLRKLKKPYLLTLHGGGLPEFARLHPGRVRRLLAGARAVTAPSRYLLEAMRPYRADLQLIPNAVDLLRYPFRQRVSPTPNLIWLRAFHELYNPCLAVEVLHQVQRNLPAARLIMVGPDKSDGSLQRTMQRAAELGLADAVEFPGGVSKAEVPAWLNRGDVFINTTNVDNTPVSVIEALACGLCVVSTNVGGLPYLLDDGEDALLVPPDDPAAMAAAVLRLLDEPGLAERLSRNGRLKAEQLDWANILPQWEALLEGVR